MRKKVLTKKSYVGMPDQRDLDAADALLELSNGGGVLLDNYLPSVRRKRGMSHGADSESTASKRLNIRFVMGKNSEKNHKKRRYEEDDLSMFSDKVGNKETNPYAERELCDRHELTRSVCSKGKQSIEVCGSVQQEYNSVKRLKNKKAEGNWQRTSYEPHSHISDHNDLCGPSSPMVIDRPLSFKKNLNYVRDWFNPMLSEATPKDEVERLLKPTKRQPSAPLTPLRHPGFTFSIIHLLSAVRVALVTQHPGEGDWKFGNCIKGANKRQKHMMDIHREALEGSFRVHKDESGINISDRSGQMNLSSLSILEIVHWVKSTPGDARILELSVPLQDLVRGVLKLFTSKTAPPGATSWKALTEYDKVSKTWSWTGPVPSRLRRTYRIEEQISPEAWGIPRRTLAKLVDSFAHWLKACQDVLQKIRSLPPPPLTLMQCSSVNERFNDRKARKSLLTLTPSCEEVRAYFRREESLRYSIPDHAFSYTALDGKKSTVAPLVRCSGKPASKIRDHFILKQDRPPQFTVLCLVRDAAARLPGRLGTRLDICILVRDSQYILEDASDLQISQVISGALDRLHYEVDPCVRFHKDWRLWVYLHGDREEEDFDQDCTSSRKVRTREKIKLDEKSDTGQGSTQTSQHDTKVHTYVETFHESKLKPRVVKFD